VSSQFDVFRLQLPAISAGLARIGLSWKGNKSVLLSCSITRLEETRNSKSAGEDKGEIEKPDNCERMYIELRLLHTSAVFHMILNEILLVLDTVEKAVRRLKLTHHPRECIANRNILLWCSTDIYGFSATPAPEVSSTGIYLIAETVRDSMGHRKQNFITHADASGAARAHRHTRRRLTSGARTSTPAPPPQERRAHTNTHATASRRRLRSGARTPTCTPPPLERHAHTNTRAAASGAARDKLHAHHRLRAPPTQDRRAHGARTGVRTYTLGRPFPKFVRYFHTNTRLGPSAHELYQLFRVESTTYE